MLQPQLPMPQSSPVEVQEPEDDDSAEILQNLDSHLASLQPELQDYLLGALSDPSISEAVVNVLGIVAGKEVYDYFANISASLRNTESAPSAQDNMATPPMGQPVLNPQTKDTSTSGGVLAPTAM